MFIDSETDDTTQHTFWSVKLVLPFTIVERERESEENLVKYISHKNFAAAHWRSEVVFFQDSCVVITKGFLNHPLKISLHTESWTVYFFTVVEPVAVVIFLGFWTYVVGNFMTAVYSSSSVFCLPPLSLFCKCCMFMVTYQVHLIAFLSLFVNCSIVLSMFLCSSQ